jgi:hypothetical protein
MSMVARFARMSRSLRVASPLRSPVSTDSSPQARRVAAMWFTSWGVYFTSSFGATISRWTMVG